MLLLRDATNGEIIEQFEAKDVMDVLYGKLEKNSVGVRIGIRICRKDFEVREG